MSIFNNAAYTILNLLYIPPPFLDGGWAKEFIRNPGYLGKNDGVERCFGMSPWSKWEITDSVYR